MENSLPFVTAVIPCRNEEKFIARTLSSIISNDYPKDKLEILLVDGQSQDKTIEIAKKYAGGNDLFKIIENPRKITPAAMNIGIQNSKGEIIIKMDAHTVYEKDYISKCVKHLQESGADNVGGVLINLPANNTLTAKVIAISLSHPFGAGNSYFRTGSKGPREVDTVAFGCYKKEVFSPPPDGVGLYNEKMAKIEDFELNSRLRKAGGKIMLFPDIIAYYYPSSENLKEFFSHNFTDGIWTTYAIKFGFHSFSFRHFIPLIFVLTLPLSIWPYISLSLFFSLKIALRQDLRYVFILPLAFFSRHFAYGLGSLWGLIKLWK